MADGQVKGFIDLGRTGVGDKWNDIALCYRSLKHNFDGTYGGKVYDDFNPDLLFEELGIEPDLDKIKWYLLLEKYSDKDIYVFKDRSEADDFLRQIVLYEK